MMKPIRFILLLLLACSFFACRPGKKAASGDDGIIEIQFLQMNDVYDIQPGQADNLGGLARVATIRKELLAKNPNTYTVLAGDFISPSVLGTLKYEGKRIRGRHMVETLNALGLDWVVFGNHEFDYDDLADLQARLDESNFTWFGANARLKTATATGQFFKNRDAQKEFCPDNRVFTVKDADGTTIRIGVFGVLIDTGKKPWVEYSNWSEAAQSSYNQLKPQTDAIVALTHLSVDDDKKLSAQLPEIPLIMGGHEHENQLHKVGKATIAKADANAKTIYIHTLRYDKKTKIATVKSELRRVTATIADEPATAAVIAKWDKIRNESLTSSGFDANKTVTTLAAPLDCREVTVRQSQCKAGELLTNAMLAAARTNPDCALINSGSIRVDDMMNSPLTEFDIVRMLPFGGSIVEVEMRGVLLRKTLDTGVKNRGNGGYLQWGKIAQGSAGQWLVAGKPLDDAKIYRVILPEFLLSGSEQNMGFLKASTDAGGKSTNPDILSFNKPDPNDKNDLRNDSRHALIRYLRGR